MTQGHNFKIKEVENLTRKSKLNQNKQKKPQNMKIKKETVGYLPECVHNAQ